MSGEIVVYVFVGIVVVALALGVWVLDARRNNQVEQDEERLEPDPNADPNDGTSIDPTDPLHRRH